MSLRLKELDMPQAFDKAQSEELNGEREAYEAETELLEEGEDDPTDWDELQAHMNKVHKSDLGSN